MDRRQRAIEQQLKSFDIRFELLRQKKHFVYGVTLPDGRVTTIVFAKSASDPNQLSMSERYIRKLLAAGSDERVG